MKKFLFLMIALVAFSFNAKADHDQVIAFNQLPAAAQTLLKEHFATKVPLVVTMDWDDYTVVYDSGEKVEFDKQGNWKEFDCRPSRVPSALIPEQIKSHIQTTFPGTTIIKLDKNRRGYEVKLNNGLDVEYNRLFQVIEIDD
ncbi:MAG: PepSY-like domain-containing protein [Muribaculaceae bacterium]|nr:PepSY-like domain-containing protein [Muribaculaceae bacterium]MBR3100178.1 PepSY-like domain-containing protein [Muribaculaceae bacterium]